MFESLYSPVAIPYDVSKGINPGGGRTFFVSSLTEDPGSDDNEGSDPQFPVLTIQAAIDKCTASMHDYVFVQTSHVADVVSILCNKWNVHLIGLSNGSLHGSRAEINMQGVDACVKISAGHLELAGFRMWSALMSCIEQASATYFNHIHHCTFGQNQAALDGIYNAGYEMILWTVDHCLFEDGLTRDGIRQTGPGPSWSSFNNNFFKVAAGKGIHLESGVPQMILGNIFYSLYSLTLNAGWAIDMGACTGAMVCGNKASAGGTDVGNNPYADGSSGAAATLKNGWADNFDGPALSAGPDATG